MRSAQVASRLRTGLRVGAGLLGVLLFGVTSAQAGIGGSATPTWPTSVTVGDLFVASVLVINQSTNPNEDENVTMTGLRVTPACRDGLFAPLCIGGDVDPGIFKVLSAIGDASTTPCAGVTFTLSPPNPTTGEVLLTPTSTVTLGPATGPVANRSCQINLTIRAFQMPTNPVIPGTGTTDPLAGASLSGDSSGLNGGASGSAQTTVSKATPGLATLSNPNGTGIQPGTSVTDTVTITKAPGAIPPTGSVRFILCQPNEVNANGCPSPAGTKIGADIPLAGNSATSDATTDTTASGKYCWRARYLGDANYNPVNHTNATTECFETLLFRITVIVCTAEATPRFHSSDVTFGAETKASANTGTATELCAAAANFNNLDAGTTPIQIIIDPNSPNTP